MDEVCDKSVPVTSARKPAPGGSRIRKLILDKVRLLGHTEHQEIFSLLQAHGIAYSSNSNGVFINLSTVPDDILATVKAFVDYCAVNKTDLDEYEKRLQECKITHKFDVITALGDGACGVSGLNSESVSLCQALALLNQSTVTSSPALSPSASLLSLSASTPTILSPSDSSPSISPVTLPALTAALSPQSVSTRSSQMSCSSANSLPSVLINGRFQATKKRFSRRKIVDRKQQTTSCASEASATPSLSIPRDERQIQSSDLSILSPEAYSYVTELFSGTTL